MSAQTGLKVSRSDIARLVLRRGMAHRIEPAAQPLPVLVSPAPTSPAKPSPTSTAKPAKRTSKRKT